MSDEATLDPAIGSLANEIIYLISKQNFLVRATDGTWDVDNPIGPVAAAHYIRQRTGVPLSDARQAIQSGRYKIADAVDIIPDQPPLADVDGRKVVNLWVAPTLVPAAGPYPRIQRILEWLTNDDPEGVRWLKHWIAAKVQNPDYLSKVAVVSTTEQGGGKGTLAFIVGEMLGHANCTRIGHRDLTRQFNGRWAEKLFILADEVVTRENVEWVAEQLKTWIDSAYIESERKGVNQVLVKNRLLWFFASNDPVAPVKLDRGDRRYTVFQNHRETPQEHLTMLQGCFDSRDKSKATPTFLAEIAGLAHELLALEVDYRWVSMPYQNEARAGLIFASASAIEQFQQTVLEDHGLLDDLLDWCCDNDQHVLASQRAEWDFGNAIAVAVLYRAFVAWCSRTGTKAVRINKFGQALAGNPKFARVRKRIGDTKRQVVAYEAPFPRRDKTATQLRALEGGK